MRKTLLLLILAVSLPLHAIGFGYHVLEVRTEADLASGILPSSVVYQFDFPVPDLLSPSLTGLSFRLDNGLEYRTLMQNPDNGEHYALHPVSYPRTYTVLFDHFSLFFKQGFFHQVFTSNDLVTAKAAIEGRFESAFERLGWLSGGGEMEGLFWTADHTERFLSSSFIGAPELSGNRMMLDTSIALSLEIDYMRKKETERDGVLFSSSFRYSPPFMPLSDKKCDFITLESCLSLSYTPLAWKRSNGFCNLSLVFDLDISERMAIGKAVPAYALSSSIWGTKAPNSSQLLSLHAALTLYGPQLVSEDFHPSVSFFFDYALAFGHELNSSDGRGVLESVSSYGFEAEYSLFGIGTVFYRIGCVFDPCYNEDAYAAQSYGVSLAI